MIKTFYEIWAYEEGKQLIFKFFFGKLEHSLVHIYDESLVHFGLDALNIAILMKFATFVSLFFKRKIDVYLHLYYHD